MNSIKNLILVFLFLGFRAERILAQNCVGPTKDVAIIAVQNPEEPKQYTFLVKNRSKENIHSITVGAIGFRAQSKMDVADTPEKLGSPKGWLASSNIVEETVQLVWLWYREDETYSIKAGEFLSGFSVRLSATRDQEIGYPTNDGSIVKPFSINGLPFYVDFSKGRCKWGRIVTVKAE